MKILRFSNIKNAFMCSRLRILVQKELVSYVDSPAAGIVFITFLLIWEYLFFKNVFLANENSLLGFFSLFPWVAILFIPALTMGSFSREKDLGTMEILNTLPVRKSDLVLSKFISSVAFTSLGALFSFIIALFFSNYGTFDWGVYLAQLLALFLVTMALTSLGIFVSTLVSSQLASMIISCALSFLFLVSGSGLVSSNLSPKVGALFERVSLLGHLQPLYLGVVDVLDVLYFLLFIVAFLTASILYLHMPKLFSISARRLSLVALLPFVPFIIYISFLGSGPISPRFDISTRRTYTLSSSTIDIVKNLNEPTTLTLYVTGSLPNVYQPIVRDIKFTLSQYAGISKGKILLKSIDPSLDPELEKRAVEAGLSKMQFNVIGNDELKVQNGYLGLHVANSTKSAVLPLAEDAGSLEYSLTSILRSINSPSKKTIGFLTGHQERSYFSDYSLLGQELNRDYYLKTISLSEKSPELDVSLDALVVAGPIDPLKPYELKSLDNFMNSGKSVAFFSDKYSVKGNLTSSTSPSNLPGYLRNLGIDIKENMVYDTKANESLNIQSSTGSYAIPYPLWVRALISSTWKIQNDKLSYVSLPWVSSIVVDPLGLERLGLKADTLLVTTPNAGTTENVEVVAPSYLNLSKEALGKITVGVFVEPTLYSARGKMVVLGDAEFLMDMFVQKNKQNLAFALDVFSWLTGEKSLSDISIKTSLVNNFEFSAKNTPSQIKLRVYLLSVLLSGLLYGIRFVYRRSKRY